MTGTEDGSQSGDDLEDIIDPIEERDVYHIPLAECVRLKHGEKLITSTAIEPSGNRMITANMDSTLNFWDFNGMNTFASPFKTVSPCENQQEIKQVDFSSNGEHALFISNDIQCFVLDREGEKVLETIKGNPYIMDAKSNKGHSKSLNYACWNPREQSEFLTCGSDSSVRIWNIHNNEKILNERRIKESKLCMVPKCERGRKIIPNCCAYSASGHMIVAGCMDGSLQIWDSNTNGVKPNIICRNVHPQNSFISCIKFSYDDRIICTRAADDTMKLFDLRNGLKSPLKVFNDLYVTNDHTNVAFSPNDQLIITGTSLKKGDDSSYVIGYSRQTFEEVQRIEIKNASAVTVEWHPKLDQLIIGKSSGGLDLYFDRKFSHQGALLFCDKAPRKKKVQRDFYHNDMLLTYDEDTERLARIGQRASKFHEGPEISTYLLSRREIRKRAPQPPTDANQKLPTMHQHMVQDLVIPKRSAEAEYYENHPREAILRHANKTPYWTAGAYDRTQPKPIFDEEEKDDNSQIKKAKHN